MMGDVGEAGIVADQHHAGAAVGQGAHDRFDRGARRFVEARLDPRLDHARPGGARNLGGLARAPGAGMDHQLRHQAGSGDEGGDPRRVAAAALDQRALVIVVAGHHGRFGVAEQQQSAHEEFLVAGAGLSARR